MESQEQTTPQEESKEELNQEPQLADMLKQLEGAPSQEQIEQWKVQHSEVFVSGFSPTELFVWRPIMRPEYLQLQVIAADPEAGMTQPKFEEAVCTTCVLYSSIGTEWASGKAGTPQTLSEQIMGNSNFLSPGAASMLVAKL
jgi:hypothetical protein